jgi:hypothetical protein
MFLSLSQSFGDGGEREKEAKPKGEKMNLGLGGENFGAEKRAEKTLGRAGEEKNKNALLGCVWVHPQNGLELPHPELVHGWLLVHSSQ